MNEDKFIIYTNIWISTSEKDRRSHKQTAADSLTCLYWSPAKVCAIKKQGNLESEPGEGLTWMWENQSIFDKFDLGVERSLKGQQKRSF